MSEPTASVSDASLFCPSCDYNLTGTLSDRCPWCGWDIDRDVLLADAGADGVARRVGIACAALAIGVGTLLGTTILMSRAPRLSLYDAVTVVAVVAAAGGQLLLGGLTLAHRRRRSGPSRELGNVLRFLGWFSLLGGLVGAYQAMNVTPGRRGVEGVVVSGVFEFALLAALFMLPGAMLLLLRAVSLAGYATLRRGKSGGTAKATERTTVPFLIEFSGHYVRTQVATRVCDDQRQTTPGIEAQIARTWEVQLALAHEEGRLLFDGALARLAHVEVTGGNLRLRLGTTSYRQFVGTNLYNMTSVRDEGVDALANPLGVSAAIVTADGFLTFGRRSDRVAFHAGYLHAVGGMIDAGDCRDDGTCDVFAAMMRETMEEMALGEDELLDMHVTGMVRDRLLFQPELLFDVAVSLPRAGLLARFDDRVAGGEHAGLEFVYDDPEAVLPFLENATSVAPITHGSILLHGRHQWGETWFEQACFRLYGQLPVSIA